MLAKNSGTWPRVWMMSRSVSDRLMADLRDGMTVRAYEAPYATAAPMRITAEGGRSQVAYAADVLQDELDGAPVVVDAVLACR